MGSIRPLGELSERITSGSRAWRSRLGSGSGRFVLAQCVRDGLLDLDPAPMVDAPLDKEADRTRLRKNDLLVTIVGEIGRVALVRHDPGEAYVSQSVALVRPNGDVDPRYLEVFLRSPAHGQAYFDSKQYGVGRGHLLLSHLRDLPIWIPEPAEQARIVEAVESRLSEVDSLEQLLRVNLKRVAVLRRSILAYAVVHNDDPTNG